MNEFEKLPGIGPKSAARLAYYLLHVPQEELDRFATALSSLKQNTQMCSICCNMTESDPCSICASSSRTESTVIVVEQPLDVLAFERMGQFSGRYHVLHGALSPMNNIGPDELKLAELMRRVREGNVQELILAMNNNLEGEGTALYIAQRVGKVNEELGLSVKVTRLAKGIPVGGEVEYADEVTLRRALEGRTSL